MHFLTVLEAIEFEIKVSLALISSKASLLGLFVVSLSRCVCVLIFFCKDTSHMELGPTPRTSFILNYLFKGLISPNTVTFWGTVSLELQQILGRDTIQTIIACKWFTSGISMKDEREQGMAGESETVTQTWHQWRKGKRKDWVASTSDCSTVWKVQVRLMTVLRPKLPIKGVPRTATMRLH